MVEKVLQFNKEKAIFWTLIGTLILCMGFYMYCIRSTVSNVVAREGLEAELSALTLSIGSKEFAYIAKRNGVTLDRAYSLGFKDAEIKTYISRKSGTEVALLPR